MKNVSIKDLAARVGVSATTVSFVLNGKGKEKGISEDLQEQIRSVAAELKYRPNEMARGLRTGQTHTLGLMVEDISNPFFARLAKVVEDEAEKEGYRAIYCSTENNDSKASGLLYMLKQRQMDGFIIIPTQGMLRELEELVIEERPLVLVDRFFPELRATSVTVDNYSCSKAGVDLMFAKGARKIALVTVDSIQQQMMDRNKGYFDSIVQFGGEVDQDCILKLPFPLALENTVSMIKEFLTNFTNLGGVFFTTNYLGVAGLEAIKGMDINIPEDLKVLCFDDNDLFRIVKPSITVIAQPIDAIGELAVRSLVNMISSKNLAPARHVFEPTLVIRDSI